MQMKCLQKTQQKPRKTQQKPKNRNFQKWVFANPVCEPNHIEKKIAGANC